MKTIRTIIIDDHQACIDELQDMLGPYPSIDISATYTRPSELETRMENEIPDLLFLDIEMPGITGLELAGKVKQSGKDCKIIFVTAYDKYAIEAIKKSAYDYLLKPVDPDELEETLQRYFKETNQNGSFLNKLKEEYQLTPRELEITDQIRKGLSTSQIAGTLNISELTVNKHRQNILQRTGCPSFSALLGRYL